MAKKFLVGGNWKMNGSLSMVKSTAVLLHDTVQHLGDSSANVAVQVVVAPPAPYLAAMREAIDSHKGSSLACCKVAAQNVSEKSAGAFTGELCVSMLQDLDIDWAIIGHSERRQLFGESDELVAAKVKATLLAGDRMSVILCVGEDLQQRESNETFAIVKRQLEAVLHQQGASQADIEASWERIVIAYEPVWAIGTGKVASPSQAQEVHAFIRTWLAEKVSPIAAQNVRIIYGGSVNGANCRALAEMADIDGFLVGGACLKPEFSDIIASMALKPRSSH